MNFKVVHFFNHCPFSLLLVLFFIFIFHSKIIIPFYLVFYFNSYINQYNQHCHFSTDNEEKKPKDDRKRIRKKTMIQTDCHWMWNLLAADIRLNDFKIFILSEKHLLATWLCIKHTQVKLSIQPVGIRVFFFVLWLMLFYLLKIEFQIVRKQWRSRIKSGKMFDSFLMFDYTLSSSSNRIGIHQQYHIVIPKFPVEWIPF